MLNQVQHDGCVLGVGRHMADVADLAIDTRGAARHGGGAACVNPTRSVTLNSFQGPSVRERYCLWRHGC